MLVNTLINSHLLIFSCQQSSFSHFMGHGCFGVVLFIFGLFSSWRSFLNSLYSLPPAKFSMDLSPVTIGQRANFVFSCVFHDATRSLSQPGSAVCQSILD